MRILHIGKYYFPFAGGIENFMGALLPAHAADGHVVAALVHQHRAFQPYAEETLSGSRLIRLPIWGRLLFTPICPAFRTQLKRQITYFKPDLIVLHMPNASAFWLLSLKGVADIPVVIHWHSDVVPSRHHRLLSLAYSFYKPFESRLLSRANAIIATSPDYLQSSIPLQPWLDKCHVIPLAINPAGEQPPVADKNSPGWPGSGLRVLCIGRLTYYKGHDYLISAIARLENAGLIIVGTGDRESRLQALIRDAGAQDRVKLFGSAGQSELEMLLADCDCLCLPSIERTEAFGLVLLEAMRAAKPVVVTDVEGSGMSWVVQHEITGLVARAEDVHSLYSCLTMLRENPTRRQDMGLAARKRFEQEFAIEKVARTTADLYNKIVSDSK